MSDMPDWTVIDRYLAGEATPGEIRVVDAWLALDDRHAALLSTLRTGGAADGASWDVEAAWSRVGPRLASSTEPRSVPHAAPRRPGPWSATASRAAAWRAAAALLLMSGAGAACWRVSNARGTAAPPAREFVTAPGQRASMRLADGSQVTLNAGSRLRWRADFGAGARDVELEGEGYFEVRHDADRPFRVHTRGAVAEDLGTRFVVRAYPELREVDVAVAEGRVALQATADTARAMLEAGDVGRVEGARARVVTRAAPPARFFGWTTGALVFDGGPLSDALPELERWYDVDVVIPDARLATRPLVARFTRGTADETLDAIALALGARWSRTGRTITLEPRR